MLFINSIWKQYFENHHEGLGTTYERFILHRYFELIKDKYSIKSVLEAPSFGMTGVSGINSIWWAYKGIDLTILDNNEERVDLIKNVWNETSFSSKVIFHPNDSVKLPFRDDSFDMTWNFAALIFLENPEQFLKEISRVTEKVIFICIPNRSNIFNIMRRIFRKKIDHENANNINIAKIKKILLDNKWMVVENGFMDIPPWPDIAMKKEDLLQRIGMKRLAEKLKNDEENYLCILDYFNGEKKEMDMEILKYSYLENSPLFFKKFWAHHQYLIFVPEK